MEDVLIAVCDGGSKACWKRSRTRGSERSCSSASCKLWESSWANFVPFLEYDAEIRRVISTTNAFESINAGTYRRTVRPAGTF
ncbi:transposase [Arthrobacter sp. Z4-13]